MDETYNAAELRIGACTNAELMFMVDKLLKAIPPVVLTVETRFNRVVAVALERYPAEPNPVTVEISALLKNDVLTKFTKLGVETKFNKLAVDT